MAQLLEQIEAVRKPKKYIFDVDLISHCLVRCFVVYDEITITINNTQRKQYKSSVGSNMQRVADIVLQWVMFLSKITIEVTLEEKETPHAPSGEVWWRRVPHLQRLSFFGRYLFV